MRERNDKPGKGGRNADAEEPPDEEGYRKKDLFYKRFGAFVSTAGFVLILLGLYGNYRQLSINVEQLQLNAVQSEKMAKSIRANVTNSTVSHVMKLDELFVTRPYLNPYFYEGKPIDAKDKKYPEVYAAAVMTLDVFDVVGNQTRHYAEFWDEPGAWDEWMIDVFAASPVLRATHERHKKWYGAKMRELRRRGEAKLEGRAAPKEICLLPFYFCLPHLLPARPATSRASSAGSAGLAMWSW